MSLDQAVAQMVAHAALLEAALHSEQTWYIEAGAQRREAVRQVHEHGVTFRACFLDAPGTGWAFLFEGDVPRAARPFIHPGDREFCIAWNVSLSEAVPA